MNNYWQINIDTGGTFTDCIAISPSGEKKQVKVLSSACLKGRVIAIIDAYSIKIKSNWGLKKGELLKNYGFSLENEAGENIENTIIEYQPEQSMLRLANPLPVSIVEGQIFSIRAGEEAPVLASRLITETPLRESLPLLEMRLGTTKGTNALLERKGAKTVLFITQGFADLLEIGTQQRPDLFALNIIKAQQFYSKIIEVEERIDAKGKVLKALDVTALKSYISLLKEEEFQSVAIAFLNSYQNNRHEKELESFLYQNGFEFITCSSDIAQSIKILPRSQTALVNAYLSPVMQNYLHAIQSKLSVDSTLSVMTSTGDLVEAKHFLAKDGLLSGPAGGLTGAVHIAKQLDFEQIITFDMGGTSTDVARFNKAFDYTYEQKVGHAHLLSPALAIETVAAGGGSVCSTDGFKLTVGPESSGAHPGPACYGNGGPLTLTDVNLLLGRLPEQLFNIPLDKQAAEKALQDVMSGLSKSKRKREEILNGFLQIANEKMASAIKKVSLQKGYAIHKYSLMGFGGAAGQHICAIARLLSFQKVIIPKDGGLLSAYGIGKAKCSVQTEKQLLQEFDTIKDNLYPFINELEREAREKLNSKGISPDDMETESQTVFMRFKGQETSLPVPYSEQLEKDFYRAYQKLYGYYSEEGSLEVESLRVKVSEQAETIQKTNYVFDEYQSAKTFTRQKTYMDNSWQDLPVYEGANLRAASLIKGPAIITYPHGTLLLELDFVMQIAGNGDAVLRYLEKKDCKNKRNDAAANEAIQLTLFTNRFTAIAEEMGSLLQRTAFSVNVKERLDYSCALLDKEGELVATAPHIPVHLGSLGVCVRSLKQVVDMKKGDVVICNHPAYGGSHLPDITLVAPVFDKENNLVAYLANRAHHAEIGGKRPGSMPPDATCLIEEGVIIHPAYLVKSGQTPDWDYIRHLLQNAPYPSRMIEDNIADLKAALASIHKGSLAMQHLLTNYGTANVLQYMKKLKEYAAGKMRKALSVYENQTLYAKEFLDDGNQICVGITIHHKQGCVLSFEGTSKTHPHNFNANLAIVSSALIYVFRLLLQEDLPLNEGLLKDVAIILPEGTLLQPEFTEDDGLYPAVVGGNTEVSQRLVDTLLKAFKVVACSQGTMNNLLFGNEHFAYYETIGGGSGAGLNFHGTDAVHSQMTNTRMTDPEIMEYRYPVRIDEFAIRYGSGGKGKFKGGNGIVRKITFLDNVKLTLISQHRKEKPYGLNGGQAGQCGKQYVVQQNGTIFDLNGICSYDIKKGEQFVIETPGGGGCG